MQLMSPVGEEQSQDAQVNTTVVKAAGYRLRVARVIDILVAGELLSVITAKHKVAM